MGSKFTDTNLQSMLASRMGWNMDDPKNPLRYVHSVGTKRCILIFAVAMDDRHVTIEDGADLYPSDQLVTQLRLFIGNGGG